MFIMKRLSTKTVLYIAIVISIFFCGCNKNSGLKTGLIPDKREIERITIYSGEENPEHIWAIMWPECYKPGGEYVKLYGVSSSLTKEDAAFLLDYVESASKNGNTGNELLCSIQISVVEDKTHTSVDCKIYDSYPEGSYNFVEIINRICGGNKEYFCMNGKVQEVTEEYFTECTGYSDDDIQGGTISDVINHLEINNVFEFHSLFMEQDYKNILDNYDTCKYLPYKVYSAPSSDEECLEFATNLAKELNASGAVEKKTGKEGNPDWYEIEDYNGVPLRVYRTETASDAFWVDTRNASGFNCVVFYEYFQGPGDASGFDTYCFVYSNDYKFAVAVECDRNNREEMYMIIKEIGDKVR